jgi:hypothetical protein
MEQPNLGDDFESKTPAALAHIPTESKLAMVAELTVENESRFEHFVSRLRTDPSIPLQQVKVASQVNCKVGGLLIDYSRLVIDKVGGVGSQSRGSQCSN